MVEGRRGEEKQNRRLEAKMGPKTGLCGLRYRPPGLSLTILPVPSRRCTIRALSLKGLEHFLRALSGVSEPQEP